MFNETAVIKKYSAEKEIDPEKYENEITEYIKSIEKVNNSIGIGKTAEVFYCKTNPNICYKIIYDKEFYQNDVAEEGRYLSLLADVSDKVTIPRPYYSVINQKKDYHVLVMEKLDAFSISELLDGRADLPEGFDYKEFMQRLKDFFELMHEKRIFHRDAHGGNIMVERKTGKPCVIDFGTAKENLLSSENPYNYINGRGVNDLYTDDMTRLNVIRKDLIGYLLKKAEEKKREQAIDKISS